MRENRELKLLFFPLGPDRPAQGQLAAAEGRGRPQDHRPDPQGGRAREGVEAIVGADELSGADVEATSDIGLDICVPKKWSRHWSRHWRW